MYLIHVKWIPAVPKAVTNPLKLLIMSWGGFYSQGMGYDPSDSLTQTTQTDKTIK